MRNGASLGPRLGNSRRQRRKLGGFFVKVGQGAGCIAHAASIAMILPDFHFGEIT